MKLDLRANRALAYPLAVGADVRLIGRVKECADLIQPGHRLLDIGCSSGWLGPIVTAKGFDDYVGVDRVIVGAGMQGGPKLVQGSVFSLPFANNTFDAACLFDVIEHLPRGTEEKALRDVWRVLKPSGKLYFSTPHADPIHTPLDPVWALGHRHYRRASIERLMHSVGFRVDRMFVAGGVVECLDHIRLLFYKHALRRTYPQLDFVDRMIERSHGHNRLLGMTLFVVGSR